jgi:pimeloyl-ACP methyl ester carboxylesterase
MDSLKMQVEVAGHGEPLVLVGGGITGWLSWKPHQERLTGQRTVARPQLLSVQYGLERKLLPDGYGVRAESNALRRAIDALGWTGAVDLVAWSYGAEITLDYALHHAERVRTLTLIEPPAFWVLGATDRLDAQSAEESREMRELYASLKGDVSEDQLADFVRRAGLVPPGQAPERMPQWPVWVEHRRSLLTEDRATYGVSGKSPIVHSTATS